MPKPYQLRIPSIAYPDGASWRLRPKGTEHRLEDRDPRGRPSKWELEGGQEPGARDQIGRSPSPQPTTPSPYVELHVHSCYSFREGASSPRELVARAAALGYQALALTDRDGLYGAMEFARAARTAGVRPIIGADVTLQGGYRLVLLAETREGYGNLCRLLSTARLAEASHPLPNPPSPPPSPARGEGGGPSPPPLGEAGRRPAGPRTGEGWWTNAKTPDQPARPRGEHPQRRDPS